MSLSRSEGAVADVATPSSISGSKLEQTSISIIGSHTIATFVTRYVALLARVSIVSA